MAFAIASHRHIQWNRTLRHMRNPKAYQTVYRAQCPMINIKPRRNESNCHFFFLHLLANLQQSRKKWEQKTWFLINCGTENWIELKGAAISSVNPKSEEKKSKSVEQIYVVLLYSIIIFLEIAICSHMTKSML